MNKTRWVAAVTLAALALVGFLLFRPDTLFTEVRVEEDLDDAFAAESAVLAPEDEGTSTTPVAPTSTTSSDATTSTTTPGDSTSSTSGEPVVVGTGVFEGIDHKAEGTATIYEQGGRFVLRFEDDTDIQNGPDLYVWLLPTQTYDGGTPAEYVDLGTLKGTVGGQNYELPSDFDVEGPWTVLIWCLRFAVPFATAALG
jgi:hypothetical protein